MYHKDILFVNRAGCNYSPSSKTLQKFLKIWYSVSTMTAQQELGLLRKEMRTLRQEIGNERRWHIHFRTEKEKLVDDLIAAEDRNDALDEKNDQLKAENERLKKQLEDMRLHNDKLSGMIWKTSAQPVAASPEDKKQRGGQLGHSGASRHIPQRIDEEKRIHLTECLSCHTPLERSETVHDRVVEDIVPATTMVTKYVIERQWCRTCKKEVRGQPVGAIPGLRFGLNLVVHILIAKYRLRLPLAKIVEELHLTFGITLSESGIQKLLRTASIRLGSKYEKIRKTIRRAKVKHADETGWRVEGENGWCWLFATSKAAYYTIEETRGKGIPQRLIGDSRTDAVLVRDDYGGYAKLPLQHQSCWTHLLRVSRDWANQETVSAEMKKLHEQLKALFVELKNMVAAPFNRSKRTEAYRLFAGRLHTIIHRMYRSRDSRTVQTRIRNQGNNLLTALLHPDVPLTNNHAERQIRPMAVIRKISGGSRSPEGATTQAVNMSIMQTIALEGKMYTKELRKLLSEPTPA